MRAALDEQGIAPDQVLVIDSCSADRTVQLAQAAGYRVMLVPESNFRHGTTRAIAVEQMRWAETLVFLTQDSIPCGADSIRNLIAAFADPRVGAAYGRQLPRPQANAIEAHARHLNYPASSDRRDFDSRHAIGFRATFCSNSFAAYSVRALDEVGGFPDVIVSEEVSAVARMLMCGWTLAYQADAKVIHSHRMTLRGEFARYFDIAVHHSREEWILKAFGHVGGEGAYFILSELRYLWSHSPKLIPIAFVKNAIKILGYQTGLREKFLPVWMKKKLSGQKTFWGQPDPSPMMEGRPKFVRG
jgi:rhamnosyltransferase